MSKGSIRDIDEDDLGTLGAVFRCALLLLHDGAQPDARGLPPWIYARRERTRLPGPLARVGASESLMLYGRGSGVHDPRAQLPELAQAIVDLQDSVSGVIIPDQNWAFFPMPDFVEQVARAAAVERTRLEHGAQVGGGFEEVWVDRQKFEYHDASFFQSVGMPVLGEPEVAIAGEGISDGFGFAAIDVFLSIRALVNPLPIGDALSLGRPAPASPLEYRRQEWIRYGNEALGAQWWAPSGFDEGALTRARTRFGRSRAFRALAPDSLHRFVPPRTDAAVATELFFGTESDFAFTNGVSDEVELALQCSSIGPWGHGVLDLVVSAIRNAPTDRPIGRYDRVAFPSPIGGIAGVVLFPFGHATLPEGKVELWFLVPLAVQELESFRRDPDAHEAWLDARTERRDVDSLFERWRMLDNLELRPS